MLRATKTPQLSFSDRLKSPWNETAEQRELRLKNIHSVNKHLNTLSVIYFHVSYRKGEKFIFCFSSFFNSLFQFFKVLTCDLSLPTGCLAQYLLMKILG